MNKLETEYIMHDNRMKGHGMFGGLMEQSLRDIKY